MEFKLFQSCAQLYGAELVGRTIEGGSGGKGKEIVMGEKLNANSLLGRSCGR